MSIDQWLNPSIRSMTPYEPGRPIEEVAREFGLDPADVCKLASNENPLGTSPGALEAARAALPDMYRYPDGGAYYLRQKLAGRLDVDPAQLVFGSGSNEILEFIGHCYMAPGRSIVASRHAFVVYKLIAHIFETRCIEVDTDGLAHNADAMIEAIEPDSSVIFVCNPNNPTGTLLTSEDIDRFMDRVPDHVLVVFDEAYAEICLGEMPDTLKYVREGRNCVVLRTFSKAYGLAGLRIGYGVGPKPIVDALQKARQPFNVNRLAQEAAMGALDDDAFIERTRKAMLEGRQIIERGCEELGLVFERSYANFMLIRVGDGAATTRELMKRGVIVRPMAGYGLPEYIRVSYGVEEENRRLVRALDEVMAGK